MPRTYAGTKGRRTINRDSKGRFRSRRGRVSTTRRRTTNPMNRSRRVRMVGAARRKRKVTPRSSKRTSTRQPSLGRRIKNIFR